MIGRKKSVPANTEFESNLHRRHRSGSAWHLFFQASTVVGIIALTLLGADSYRQAALDAGADAFVPKSRLSFDLVPAIKAAYRSHQQPTETSPAESALMIYRTV